MNENRLSSVLQGLWLFPGENFSSEVTIRGSLLENGVLQLQVLDNTARPEVKVLLDNFCEFSRCLAITSAIVLHGQGQGLRNTNGIGNLY